MILRRLIFAKEVFCDFAKTNSGRKGEIFMCFHGEFGSISLNKFNYEISRGHTLANLGKFCESLSRE